MEPLIKLYEMSLKPSNYIWSSHNPFIQWGGIGLCAIAYFVYELMKTRNEATEKKLKKAQLEHLKEIKDCPLGFLQVPSVESLIPPNEEGYYLGIPDAYYLTPHTLKIFQTLDDVIKYKNPIVGKLNGKKVICTSFYIDSELSMNIEKLITINQNLFKRINNAYGYSHGFIIHLDYKEDTLRLYKYI